MMILLMMLSLFANADSPRKWENAKGIVERHEFYQNGEVILKPANSWQVLFALTFLDSRFQLSKDCVYYRVPGDEPGKIKILTLPAAHSCADSILTPGESEIANISRLHFATSDQSVKIEFMQESSKQSWSVTTMKDWKKPDPKILLSSSDYKSPRFIYLATGADADGKYTGTKDGSVCHDINLDCQEKSPSSCSQCDHGWFEIPNGCLRGPKICGENKCGGKDQPACRRGMKWQRKEMEFDCRVDTSFAWCSGKLTVSCEGDRAYCR